MNHPPPLPHERVERLVGGFSAVAKAAADAVRAHTDNALDAVIAREELGDLPGVQALLTFYGDAGMRQLGWSPDEATEEADLLGVHLFYAANHELHRRKTFWVDAPVAWALGHTVLDVEARMLELPFPAFAVVFTDASALELAEEYLAKEEGWGSPGQPPTLATFYVIKARDAAEGAVGLYVTMLFDGPHRDWPFIVCRDLHFLPEQRIDAVLASHFPDVAVEELDDAFTRPELERLLRLLLNAVLYITSPAAAREYRPSPARRMARNRRKHGREPMAPTCSADGVYFLPGSIDIRATKAAADGGRAEHGRVAYRRFIVRGHWRRPAESWKERHLRWIAPHWKGPDMAAVVERQYRLRE